MVYFLFLFLSSFFVCILNFGVMIGAAGKMTDYRAAKL